MSLVLGQFLSQLRRRGVLLDVRGHELVVDAPRGLLGNEDWAGLSALKMPILQQLGAESEILAMSLDEFTESDLVIETQVPWLPDTLLFVPRPEHLAQLVSHGIERGRLYLAQELTKLTTVLDSAHGKNNIRNLAHLKRAFEAEILADEWTGSPTTATPLFRTLRKAGIEIEYYCGQLLVHTPEEPASYAERRSMLEACDESRGFEAALLMLLLRDMPDHCEKLHLARLEGPVHLVAPESAADALVRAGVPRGHIWTPSEAADVIRIWRQTPETFEAVAQLKAALEAVLVGWVEEVPKRDTSDWRCLSTTFWESIHGETICAVCHPPPAPHLVKHGLGDPVRAESLSHPPPGPLPPRSERTTPCTMWVVYRTATGQLDAHHEMLAYSIDPKDVVARVTARDGATAIRIALEQTTRGP